MTTKFLHLGIASAIAATMGLAQAQSSPASGAIIHDAAPTQPAELSAPAAPSVTTDGVPGISNESRNSQDPALSSNYSSSVSNDVPPDSLANVDERRNQGIQSSDGMNIPPAFAPGSVDVNANDNR